MNTLVASRTIEMHLLIDLRHATTRPAKMMSSRVESTAIVAYAVYALLSRGVEPQAGAPGTE